MGILSDTLEDAAEIRGQFLDTIPLSAFPAGQPIPPTLVPCPLCGEMLESSSAQRRHIVDVHRDQFVYVRVNNRIIHDDVFVEGDLSECAVIMLGNQEGNLELLLNGRHCLTTQFSESLSLMPHLRHLAEGEVTVKVGCLNILREYTLYVKEQPNFQSDRVDTKALKLLFLPLDQKKEPFFSDYHREVLNHNESKLIRRYAAGLYDYAVAFHASNKGEHLKDHFESALTSLRIFKTNFATTCKRILALRMNCFKLLQDCKSTSRFFPARCFFNDRWPLNRQQRAVAAIKPGTSECGVYIDNFTERFLEALNTFYSNDDNILAEICKQLQGMLSPNDKNNSEKLALLLGRSALRKHRTSEALKHYEILINHPFFGEEAKEVLNGLGS